jgi:hypothetical protein
MESSMPRLVSIAESVLNARGTAVDPDRRAGSTDIRAHTPTAGTVRAAAVAPSSTGDARETTLTLDREELARAHRAEASRRRWFPFGRR